MAAVLLVAVSGVMVLNGGVGGSGPTAHAAATAGCGRTPTLTSGTRSIQTSGKNRSYILRVPDNYDMNRPYRLIFGFHWLGGTANDVDSGGADGFNWSYYGLRALANNSAIFVAPQGFNNGWANSGGEDIVFVDDMVRQIQDGLCVDTTQLYALGFSYGGAMSYSVACSRATVFRAVAVYAGGVLSGCSGGTQPIAYIGLHGISDTVLNISGGRSMRDRFVRNNGCTAQSPPEPAAGSQTHRVTAYSGCRAGYPVVWAAFDGGHMPGPIDGCNGCQGWRTWTKDEVWRFFTQFQSGSPSTPPTSSPPTSLPPTTVPTSSRPPTTATTSRPPSTPPTGGACSATYRTVNSWPGGFQGEVTVTAGSSAVNGWTVRWSLASGQTVTQVWNGTLSASGSSVSVANAPYNGSVPANGSTTFGFLANGTASSPSLTCSSP
jgi:poly(3-hydroxybutyrate) depolymerase